MNRRDPSFKVQLYGPTVGYGSFARVAAGMRAGLEAVGKLAGFTPTDEEVPCGSRAPCSVYIGPPSLAGAVPQWHGERWILLAPNSSWIPEGLLRRIWPYVTGFLAPSQWAAGVLRGYVAKLAPELGTREVSVWQHGVGPEFGPRADRVTQLREDYAGGTFRVLHLASTRLERKGTSQLVEAWCQLVDAGSLARNSSLRLVLDEPPNWPSAVARMAERLIEPGNPHARLRIIDRQGASSAMACTMYQSHHLVCQPSRGEGFGLVPLEARASGVPVLMTACTGHAEHVPCSFGWSNGVRVVLHGEDAPIDDGPGAMAPSVSVSELRYSLESAYLTWPGLSTSALKAAPMVGEQWSWSAVTERWLNEEREK